VAFCPYTCICIDVAGAELGANAAAVNGDEVLSMSISASVLNAQSAQAFDALMQQMDNRISEMIDNNATGDEKCTKLLFSFPDSKDVFTATEMN